MKKEYYSEEPLECENCGDKVLSVICTKCHEEILAEARQEHEKTKEELNDLQRRLESQWDK